MKLKVIAPIVVAVLAALPAWGQSCPQGISPAGNPSCLPPGVGEAEEQGAAQAPRPLGRWQTTYGSLYNDPNTGQSGVAVGKKSKREARRVAKELCEGTGSKGCKELMLLDNQCGAFASSSAAPAEFGLAWGPAEGDTVTRALQTCHKAGGKGCKVIYAGCSKPVFEYF